MEKYNADDLNFPWGKLLCIFRMVYNFIIIITRIHFLRSAKQLFEHQLLFFFLSHKHLFPIGAMT